MSNVRHSDAILEGHDGPFFPPAVDYLRRQLDEAGNHNGAWLRKVGDAVDGFVGEIERATTSDGYAWFWSLEFSRGLGEVTILIPWSQDWDKSHGTQSDRSIAVHTRGTDEATANEVAQQFMQAAKQQQELDAVEAANRQREVYDDEAAKSASSR